ncbi:MAG: hypothetical protein ACRCXB_08385 [Aeromonadaceae bacterium]
MAAQKIKDLAVKVGSYTDGQGQEKGRYQNVGSLMRSDDGNEFIVLHRWFNPAGVPNPENRDSVLISCFEPKQQQQQQQGWGQQSPAPQQQMQRQPQMNQQQPNPRQQQQQQRPQQQQQWNDDQPPF